MDIREFFEKNGKAALAYSGGCDSSFLLYEGLRACADIKVYYVKTEFQSGESFEFAVRSAEEMGADVEVIEIDLFGESGQGKDGLASKILENDKDRCYYCKSLMMERIRDAMGRAGYEILMDGTNASDDTADRPGSRALDENQVISPLRMCGMTKSEIRERAGSAGLKARTRPSDSCLATRIEEGTAVTRRLLERTAAAEARLADLGFSGHRVKTVFEEVGPESYDVTGGGDPAGGRVRETARVRVREDQLELLLANRHLITSLLSDLYDGVSFDWEGRKDE